MADAAAQQAEFGRGAIRGRRVELTTQLDRARQDVDLGWWYWGRRRIDERRRPTPGRVAGPLVSVITPVYRTVPEQLGACLDSVAAQTYADWEHVVVDDGSGEASLSRLLERRAAAGSHRLRVITLVENAGIVAASNAALAEATGEYVVMLDHDDLLDPHALERLVAAMEAAPDAPFGYSDNDILRADGRMTQPFYKPDFSPERLRNHNYVLHCVIARRQAITDVGGFRAGYDGAQDHDLLLRLSELGPAVHVAEVLYHWREAPASVASDPAAKPYAYDAGVRSVQDHLDRQGIPGTVMHGAASGVYRIRRRVSGDPLVSVVIPTRGATSTVWGESRCHVVEAVRSLAQRSGYQRLEFVVVADAETPREAIEALQSIAPDRLSVVRFDAEFNFSAKVNAGANVASGEMLLVLNDDTELIEPGSVGEMLALAQQPDVGIVGAKLLFGDGTLQHAGHVFPGLATHALLGYPGDHPGPYRMCLVERECSGVTAAAALISAARFGEFGGFDELLPHNFNDVDLCFRIRRAGLRVIWTPHASWYHFESVTRDAATGDAERDLLLSRWKHEIEHDPYFNPNLAPHRSDWLERPGRSGAPPYYRDANGRRRFG